MSTGEFLTRLPLFALAYGLTGIFCGSWWLRDVKYRSLRALSGVLLALAMLNAYVEMWGSAKHISFENVTLFLFVSFLLPYSILCVRLMEYLGIRDLRMAFVNSLLPLVYVLALGTFLGLRDFASVEHPALAVYIFILLICALHAAAFAAAKTQVITLQRKPEAGEDYAEAPPSSLLRQAVGALVVPLLIALTFQVAVKWDWRLFGVNFVMTLSLLSLFLITFGWRWRSNIA